MKRFVGTVAALACAWCAAQEAAPVLPPEEEAPFKIVIEDVPEEEKREALDILMEHYPVPAGFHYNEAVVAQTRVLKLTVESMTGKRREKK